jgi:hypothetical protein
LQTENEMKSCDHNNELTLTDMGQCVTINMKSIDSFQSNSVGEQNSGLLLIINAELYETMNNMPGGNGIKANVFDPTNNVDLISDYGFYLNIGFYTTVNILAKHNSYLESPYGKCGSRLLNHTSGKYSYTKCVRDQQTEHLMAKCGCRNYYMPGQAPECTLQQYLACSNTVNSVDNLCPSDCEEKLFETKLSFTTLSPEKLLTRIDNIKKRKFVCN